MHTIGLTGGIGTGKSLVLAIFSELGCCTLRADELAKQIIFAPGSTIADMIIAQLGAEIADAQGGIDKEKFSRILFADWEKRQLINQLVHPLVGQARQEKINAMAETHLYDFFIYESALLVESGLTGEFEKIIITYCAQKIQLQRLMSRDHLTRKAALARIQSQLPIKEKLKMAHYSIDTGGSTENTRTAVLEAFHLLKVDFQLP